MPDETGVVRLNEDEYPHLVDMIEEMHRNPKDRISPSYGTASYPDGEEFTLVFIEESRVISQITLTVSVFRSAVEITVESCFTDRRHRGRGIAASLAGIAGEIVLSGYEHAGQVDTDFPEKVMPVICGDFTDVSRRVGEKIRMVVEARLGDLVRQPDPAM